MVHEDRYLIAYFGPLSGYYLDIYKEHHSGKKFTFNVGPFLGGLFWWLYRKLYLHFLVIIAIGFFIEILESIILILLNVHPDAVEATFFLQAIVISVFLGFLGNYFYIKQTDKRINKVLNFTLSEDERIKLLKRKGGTSWMSVIFFILIFIMLIKLSEKYLNQFT